MKFFNRFLNKEKEIDMFAVGDKVKWGNDEGVVSESTERTFNIKFLSGATFTFVHKTNKFDDGKNGVGEIVTLVKKAAGKKTVKLYRWEKSGTTSTGRAFIKQTEGLYDEDHAKEKLEGYTKVEGSERIFEVTTT